MGEGRLSNGETERRGEQWLCLWLSWAGFPPIRGEGMQ